ncbi:MAG: hypothetical protein WDZ59_14955 [Pirellulales bacterium]
MVIRLRNEWKHTDGRSNANGLPGAKSRHVPFLVHVVYFCAKTDGSGKLRMAKSPKKAASTKRYFANIYPGNDEPLPEAFSSAVLELQNTINQDVLLLVQNDSESPYGELGPTVWRSIFELRKSMKKGKPIGVLLDSPDGYARESYKIARFLIRHCGGYSVFVPSYAKSAATMLALGGDFILLGNHAELGPIDAQAMSPDEGRCRSVLDEVQTLERLNAFALRSLDETMQLLIRRTGMRVDRLLPEAMSFVDNFVRPLMESIDTTRWTEMSRVLKVGEDYTIRLLKRKYPTQLAESIARELASKYTEHGFVIDAEELEDLAQRLHLDIKAPLALAADDPTIMNGKVEPIFEKINPFLHKLTAIGFMEPRP